MAERRRRFDADFREGAVRIVLESGRPIAEVARELGVHDGTLGNWVKQARAGSAPGALAEDEREELVRLRREVSELRMQGSIDRESVRKTGLLDIHLTGVEWGDVPVPAGRSALPSVAGRVPGVVLDRRRLLGLSGVAAVA